MKPFVSLLFVVLLVAVGGLFFVPGPGGQPVLTVHGFVRQAAGLVDAIDAATRRLLASLGDGPRGDGGREEVVVYRWQDASGTWHYTDEPPRAGAFERVLVDAQRNVQEGMGRALRTAPQSPSGAAPGNALPGNGAAAAPLPIPGGRVRELIDEAQGVQETLDQRAREMERRLRDQGG